jgi:hypothetical protein
MHDFRQSDDQSICQSKAFEEYLPILFIEYEQNGCNEINQDRACHHQGQGKPVIDVDHLFQQNDQEGVWWGHEERSRNGFDEILAADLKLGG